MLTERHFESAKEKLFRRDKTFNELRASGLSVESSLMFIDIEETIWFGLNDFRNKSNQIVSSTHVALMRDIKPIMTLPEKEMDCSLPMDYCDFLEPMVSLMYMLLYGLDMKDSESYNGEVD